MVFVLHQNLSFKTIENRENGIGFLRIIKSLGFLTYATNSYTSWVLLEKISTLFLTSNEFVKSDYPFRNVRSLKHPLELLLCNFVTIANLPCLKPLCKKSSSKSSICSQSELTFWS